MYFMPGGRTAHIPCGGRTAHPLNLFALPLLPPVPLQEIKRFAKPLGMGCVAVFGGSGVANQISELKRGTEMVVCTPGRMIDLLVTSNGGAWAEGRLCGGYQVSQFQFLSRVQDGT